MAFGPPKLKSVKGGWSATRVRTATMVLQLESNTVADGPFGAMLATGVPLLYDFWDLTGLGGTETDQRMFCIDKQAHRITDKRTDALHWFVVLNYSTLSKQQRKRAQHPLSRPAEISSTHRQISTIAAYDNQGNLIANSAGFAFDPPKEEETSRKIIRITKNFDFYHGGLGFIDRVNQNTFQILNITCQPRTLKCNTFDEEDEYEEVENLGNFNGPTEVYYWRRTVEFEFKPDTWDLGGTIGILDTGVKDKTGKDLTDPTTGMVTTEPLKLDGNGNLLNPQTGNPVFLPPKQTKFTADFDTLNMLP